MSTNMGNQSVVSDNQPQPDSGVLARNLYTANLRANRHAIGKWSDYPPSNTTPLTDAK